MDSMNFSFTSTSSRSEENSLPAMNSSFASTSSRYEENNHVATVDLHSCPCPGKKTYVIRLGSRETFFFDLDDYYVVDSILGKGGYGYVCSAQDISKDPPHQVAIKVFYNIFKAPLDTMRLLREVRILRRVTHPFIIRLVNIMEPLGHSGFDCLAIVLDKMKTDLHKFLYNAEESCCKNSGEDHNNNDNDHEQSKHDNSENEEKKEKENGDFDKCKLILNQLLRGLLYLHSGNILHRDLKPQNVLIGPNGIVKICDFGLSRTETTGRMTRLVVSSKYRPPELHFPNPDSNDDDSTYYSSAIDIWSLGCIFAELLGHDKGDRALFQNVHDLLDLDVYLREIFSVVPKPCDDDPLDFFEYEGVRRYVWSLLPEMPSSSVRSVVSRAPPDAVDLLERMLVFDPRKRITAAEALEHPYMADVTVDFLADSLQLQPWEVEILENGSAPYLFNIRDDEIEKADKYKLEKLIYEECASFRADLRN